MRHRSVAATFVVLFAAGACSPLFGPGEELHPGVLEYYGDPLLVIAPDSVTRSVPFQVRVRTYGNGGCVSKGVTEVEIVGTEATVSPFDLVLTPRDGVACTAILGLFEHQVEIVFDTEGEATLSVVGVSEPGLAPVEAMFSIWVRP